MAEAALVAVLLQPASASRVAERGKVKLNSDECVLTTYARLLDQFDPNFNIVTP
jgi:alkyl sulfatase BDS1-like metallo-beta-lactamase superfamily hydrolase